MKEREIIHLPGLRNRHQIRRRPLESPISDHHRECGLMLQVIDAPLQTPHFLLKETMWHGFSTTPEYGKCRTAKPV
jgi:hypothetical protein